MRPSLSIKTLFRTPFKTLLTFLLLTAVTFALFSRVAEYSITDREIKNAAKEYCGVGSAEIAPALESHPGGPDYIKTDPRMFQYCSENSREYFLNMRYRTLSQGKINSILELPYITSSSTRYMTAGVSDKYWRLDDGEDYYSYTARFVIEGTLSEIKYNVLKMWSSYNELTLENCTLLAGDPACLPKNKKITIDAFPDRIKQGVTSIGRGSRVTIMLNDKYIYDTEYLQHLTIGDRYVFVGRYEALGGSLRFFLSDHLSIPWCEAVQTVGGQPENYLADEQFAPLRELIELTDSDLHTFDVVYTDDMSSIMRFAEGSMAVTKGRELTMGDSISNSNVCVVSKDFAYKNSIKLGDKITLKLGSELFEQYKGLGAVAVAHERYSPPEKTVELEIVGIYMDTDGKKSQLSKPHWSYSVNTVFVPKSLLPLDEGKLDDHVFSPAEFSFMVDDAWNIPSFLEKAAPEFEKMGLTLIFDDDGWSEIVDSFKLSSKLSIIAILALTGAVIAATGFIVFLFIGRKKKEYAIMRALGTTVKESTKALVLPLMASAVPAVLVGSCAAWIYTTNNVAEKDTLSIIKNYTVNTSIPLIAAIGCILGEILLVLLFTLFALKRISAIPPLMLLQNSQNRKARSDKQVRINKSMQDDRKPVCAETKVDVSMVNAPISAAPGEMTGKTNFKRVYRLVLCYIIKHIRRSAGKSMLSILLPALLYGAVGQFAVMQKSYVDLCSSTKIKPKFINGLHLITVKQIKETGYVKNNPYYEYTHYAEVNNTSTDWALTNDICRYTGEEAEITYADGYNESCMNELGDICIAGSRILNEYGLKPGDKIHVTMSGALGIIKNNYILKYRREHPKEKITDEKILEMHNDEILKRYENDGSIYTIVGSVTTPSGRFDKMFFSPGTLDTKPIFGFDAPLDLVEFILADNLKAYEFRSYAENIVGGDFGKYLSNRITFIMDTSKIDNLINTIKLLGKLFPVVVAVVVLIGGLVCGLIIIQAAKEAAIMRVLGTTRRRTAAILVIEQIALCIIGLAAGACGLLLYNGASVSEIAAELRLFAALYFAGSLVGALFCAIIVTRSKVLELLQTKE